MVKVVIALAYVFIVLLIGFFSSKKVKSTEDFAVAGRGVPFWTNVNSIASMATGAGATMGVASVTYACGISGNIMGIACALGGVLCGILFVKKIYEEGETTVPGLLRKKLGNKVAAGMNILCLLSFFAAAASQVRSLGVIAQMFLPFGLTECCILMTIIAVIYVILGGRVATTKTDSVNIIIMILSVCVILPIIVIKGSGGFTGMVAELPGYYFEPFTMGPMSMFSMLLWLTATGMTDGGYFLHYLSAKNAGQAKKEAIVAFSFVVLPYMLCCGLIGLAGALMIPGLESSDSIFPALVVQYTSPVLGGIILAGLLAAVMGTTAGVLMITSVTFTENVVKRINPKLSNKSELLCNRIGILVIAVLGIIVAINASSIVAIMQDIAAPTVSVALPLFVAMFYWKKITSKGAFLTVCLGAIITIFWYVWGLVAFDGGSPFGVHHIIVGTVVSTVILIVSCLATYREGSDKNIDVEVA